MSENQQEIAPIRMLHFLEEGILAGVGVLLLFLGYVSSGLLTTALSIVTGILLLFTAYRSVKSKMPERINVEDAEDEHINEEEERDERKPEPVPETEAQPASRQRSVERKEAAIRSRNFVERTSSVAMTSNEPQSEFHNLLSKVLGVIKEVCFAHSAVFFWINKSSGQLVVEAKVTESSSFIAERKISVGNDIVSRIGLNGAPELINDIVSDSERDILHYYTSLQDVRSFIGVPVFYSGDGSSDVPIGVIAVDSKAQDAFGDETLSTLGHFAKLISSMLASSTEKYDLLFDSKLSKSVKKLKSKLGIKPSLEVIVNSLMGEIETTIEWDALALILFDDHQQQWAVSSARSRTADKFATAKQPIDVAHSVVGTAIRTSIIQRIDLTKNTEILFSANESSVRSGWLTVIPLTSNGKSFGAVAVLSGAASLTTRDVEAVQFLSSPAVSELEIIELNSIINDHVVIDELTGTLTKKNFLLRLGDELIRATDRGEDLSLVLIAMSHSKDIETRYGIEGRDAALVNVAAQLRASVRQYDIVARFDESTFALILTDTIASDAFLWAEKIRAAVASTIINTGAKSFSVSVTIGISGAASRMQSEELLKNATYVLDQAQRAGGNIVRVF